jgi:hypothetical protein
MSEITERIQEYHDEETDWPTLRDWLINYRWGTPQRYDDPVLAGIVALFVPVAVIVARRLRRHTTSR